VLAKKRGVAVRLERGLAHAGRLADIAALTDAIWMSF
jgi:hypothetical protein